MNEEIINITKKSGLLALSYFNKQSLAQETKRDGTLVTEADKAVSDFLIKKLSKFYPVLSEEDFDIKRLNKDKFFLIDPIDGTVSFSKKENTWVILITLMKGNADFTDCQPILSIVYQPLEDKLYVAEKNKGAYLISDNKKTILKTKKQGNRIIVSPNYKQEDLDLIKLKHDSISFEYGGALKVVRIIEGKADIYPVSDRWFGVWDLAAPYLLINESGGIFKFLNNYKFNINHPKLNEKFIVSA